MKMRTSHIVPLARQTIESLVELHSLTGKSEWLFPGEGPNNKHMSNNTILKGLERMGYKGTMTGHGFCGLASTAYNHAQYLKPRAKMMQDWADFLDAEQRGARVLRCSRPSPRNSRHPIVAGGSLLPQTRASLKAVFLAALWTESIISLRRVRRFPSSRVTPALHARQFSEAVRQICRVPDFRLLLWLCMHYRVSQISLDEFGSALWSTHSSFDVSALLRRKT